MSKIVPRETIEKMFLDFLLKNGALKIASSSKNLFMLKSGRLSPYFVNIGTLTDGDSLSKMKWAFSSFIALLLDEGKLEDFDFIFGSAYKGINLAVLACEGLSELYGINTRYLYDRKEEKNYGDVLADRIIVGSDHFKEGQKILLIDDVITTGITKIEALAKLKILGEHKIVGLLLAVDRQEKMGVKSKTDEKSPIEFIQQEFNFPVFSVLNSKKIFNIIKDHLSEEVRCYWITYYEKYGVTKI